jgi:CheY-like chemotaxis protein
MSSGPARDCVLIIDDDPDLRTLIETIGQVCGVSVLQASDCNEGLSILEREYGRIKMILLDYFMPGMEPAKCAYAILTKAGSSIPVVLLTAAVDPAARAAELKISYWISKPFEASTLTNLLAENVLPRKSSL